MFAAATAQASGPNTRPQRACRRSRPSAESSRALAVAAAAAYARSVRAATADQLYIAATCIQQLVILQIK